MTTAFGIDFGTTNTRVAFFDGERVRVVPFTTKRGTVYQLPTLVAYQDGEPVAYGVDAAQMQTRGVLFPEPLKWLLGSPEPVEVQGGKRDRVDVVADYLKHLRTLVAASLPRAPLDRAAVTIPVHYPPAARQQLAEAFRQAGIQVTHFFFEPIAAIYAGLAGEPVAGVAAVFDWGGGSLDIATVQLRNGLALTRQVDGWHRGGTHFDRMIAEQAVNDFLSRHRDSPVAQGVTTDTVLDHLKAGRDLRLQAEDAKIQLGRQPEVTVSALKFLGLGALSYKLTRAAFSDLIAPDLTGGLARLNRAVAASGVTPRTLARLFLSGGTCRIRDVEEQIGRQFGDRLTAALRLPDRLVDKRAAGGLDDIGNATAVGAALLAAFGADPVFANNIGIRLAGGEAGEQFHPVFRANDPVPFDAPRQERLFVSDAGSGVARLLVCDQDDPATQPAGRLLRVVPVPIEKTENWVDARFTLDRHLTLRVEAAGRKHIRVSSSASPQLASAPVWIQSLNLGFRLPTAS